MAVVFLAAIFLVYLIFQDGPPTEDAAMLPQWSERGGDSNPLAVFCRELDAGSFPKLEREYSKLPEAIRKRKEGTEALLRDVLKEREFALVHFDKLMATDPVTWQWPGGPKIADLPAPQSTAIACVSHVVQTVEMRCHLLCLDGRPEEAAQLALMMCRFGRGLQQSEGGMIHMLVAITGQAVGQRSLQQALTHEAVSVDALRATLSELGRIGQLERAEFQFCLRSEYRWNKRILEVATGQVFMGIGQREGEPTRRNNVAERYFGALHKPNRSIALLYELFHPVHEGLGRSWSDGFAAAMASDKRMEELRPAENPMRIFDPNLTGKSLVVMGWGGTGSIMLDKAIAVVTLHRHTEAMVAIRLCELEHGSLPNDLHLLVPAYLSAVPMDEFSGQAMKWNATTGTLYSIGPDGKDDHGSVNDERPNKGADWGKFYWWRAKPGQSTK